MNVTAKSDERLDASRTVPVIGFGRRLVANLVDGFLLLFFTFILVFCISFVLLLLGFYDPAGTFPFTGLLVLLGLILSLAYYIGYWRKSGQTPGKILLFLKVTSTDGSSLTWGKAVLRYIGYILSGLVLSLGFLWLAFDRKRQGWHDKLAGTYVIYGDDSFSQAEAVEFTPSDQGKGWIWLVLWVIVAVTMPIALLSSLLILGPAVDKLIATILRGLI